MADLALLVLTLFWGTTFTLVKGVLAVASTGVFLAARFGIAAAALGAAWVVRRERATFAVVRDGAVLGAFVFGGFVLQTLGLASTTPARSGFITGLATLVVPFVARFVLGRRVRAAYWFGTVLAVVGLAWLTRPFSDGVAAEVRWGDLLTLGCALAFAFQIILTSEWAPRHPLVPFVTVQLVTTLAGALAWTGVEGVRFAPGGVLHFAGVVAFTGLAMTALAFFIMNWAQRRTTAVRAALIFALEPVAAALFSHYWGGEPLGPADWIGGGLIVLGVLVGEIGGALEDRARAAARPAA